MGMVALLLLLRLMLIFADGVGHAVAGVAATDADGSATDDELIILLCCCCCG